MACCTCGCVTSLAVPSTNLCRRASSSLRNGSSLLKSVLATSARSARSSGAPMRLSTSANARCRTVGFELLPFQFFPALFAFLRCLLRVGSAAVGEVYRAVRLGGRPLQSVHARCRHHNGLAHALAWFLVGRERLLGFVDLAVRFRATYWFLPSTALFAGVLAFVRNLNQLRFRGDLTPRRFSSACCCSNPYRYKNLARLHRRVGR